MRTQLNAIDPQGYSTDLQISRFDASDRAAAPHGRVSHYDLLEEIGKGGMAVVYKGLDRDTEAIVAVKRVRTGGGAVDEAAIRREIDIYRRLQEIDSAHVLGVRDIFQEGETYALVTEFADGGSLWDLMGGDTPDEKRTPLDEETTRNLVLDVLNGLSDLHEHDIVHRDIKPQNILRCDDDWKIADFGISKLLHDPVTGYTFQGAHTAPWAPPEQMEGAPAHPSADIYAMARVIGFLLTGSRKKDDLLALQEHWTRILEPCVTEAASERPDVSSLQAQISSLTLYRP